MTDIDLAAIEERRARIRKSHLRAAVERPPSSARGLHHAAVLCSDVEQTVRFYQDLLEFPLTDIFENRDYRGSNHFFFDIGNQNLIAFFDFPGLGLGPHAEVLGGLHHIAIPVEAVRGQAPKETLAAAAVSCLNESGPSIYCSDPDGLRVELIADPLGEM